MPFKSIEDYRSLIAACARRALTGQTPSALRSYSFSFDQTAKRIMFKAEVERELTEDEREDLAVVETEISADFIFGDDTMVETEVKIAAPDMALTPSAIRRRRLSAPGRISRRSIT